jgi:4-diphosphocytidyl-2-C-methyl-D-erythritol kinase
VGPTRGDGKHEVLTVLQALDLADRISVRRGDRVEVAGFAGDTLVRRALEIVRDLTGSSFVATIDKRIPVAAGLGGGSSDAAAALRGANALLGGSLSAATLQEVAAGLGADAPFFLHGGAALGTGDGSDLEPLDLPTDYAVLLVLPRGAAKESTGAVYAAFDERAGDAGFEERAAALRAALRDLGDASGLAALPPNDLVSSPLAGALLDHGALRADVTGAGPVVYGLFASEGDARAVAGRVPGVEATWIARPTGPLSPLA